MPAKKIDPKSLVAAFKRKNPRAYKEIAEWSEIIATYVAEAKHPPKTSKALFAEIDNCRELDAFAELHFALGYVTAAAEMIGCKPWDLYDTALGR